MAVEAIQLGSTVNVIITVTEDGSAIDISTASLKNIRIIYPDGTEANLTTTFVNTGSDGKVQGEFDSTVNTQPGTHKAQVEYTLGGNAYITEPESFVVKRNP